MITPIPAGPSATADATGAATFTYQAPNSGETWTGVVSIPNAPPTARVRAFLTSSSSTAIAQWNGATAGGPIQTFGQQLIVTATGLTPLTVYQLIWTGQITTPPDAAPPVIPGSTSQSVSATVERINLGTFTGTSATVTCQPGWRSLGIMLFAAFPASTNCTVVGVTTGNVYLNAQLLIGNGPELLIPIDSALDAAVTVTMAGSVTFGISASLGDDVLTASINNLPLGISMIRGLRFAPTVTITASGNSTVLSPAAPFFPVVQRWCCVAPGTAPTAGGVFLLAGNSSSSNYLDVALFSAVPFGRDVGGTNAYGQNLITILNNTNQSLAFIVWYDLVNANNLYVSV